MKPPVLVLCLAFRHRKVRLYWSGTDRLTRTSFLSAGSIGSEFVIVSLGLTCMIDRCFDSRMQLNVQLLSEGPSRNSTGSRQQQTAMKKQQTAVASTI